MLFLKPTCPAAITDSSELSLSLVFLTNDLLLVAISEPLKVA
jgi:hypothetical protein